MKITAIRFVLENCEVVDTINLENCYHIIHAGACRKTYDIQHGDFFESESTNYLHMTFDLDEFKVENKDNNEVLPMDRLLYRDVTSVCFVFEDGTEKQLYVPWRGWALWGANHAMKICYEKNEHYNHIIIIFNGQPLLKRITADLKTFVYRHIYCPIENWKRKQLIKAVHRRIEIDEKRKKANGGSGTGTANVTRNDSDSSSTLSNESSAN